MTNLKHFSSSPISLGLDLLALQNGMLENSNHCDMDYLKLNCSDGYLMIHKILLPSYQTSISSKSSPEQLELESFPLPNLTITQASKLLFLIYTGEVLISKSDQKAVKPILEEFKIFHVKRLPLSRGPTSTKTVKRKRSRSGGTSGGIITSGSTKEEIIRRKVAGVKNLPDGDGGGGENVFIFGDGTIMEMPISTTPAFPSPTNLVYNLNGDIILNDSSEPDKGFHCPPCSLIFCDSSDFLSHSSSSKCLNRNPPPPLTPKVKVIKVEPGFIKVEEQIHVDTLYFNDDDGGSRDCGEDEASPNLCLICLHPCKDAVELIIHSEQSHMICSEEDYDYASWTCKLCRMTCGSYQLSVFLQHAYYCKNENGIYRKRPASTSPHKNKRRKIQNPSPPPTPPQLSPLRLLPPLPPKLTPQLHQTPPPPKLTPHLPSNPLISHRTPHLHPTPPPPKLTPNSLQTPPPPKLTPQHLQDNQPMENKTPFPYPSPESTSSPLDSPLIIKNTFQIPKLSKSNTPPSSDDLHYPTPTLITRLPIKLSPPTPVSTRPISLAIRNSNNRKLKLLVNEEHPTLYNPSIKSPQGINITLTSGTSVSPPNTSSSTKPPTIKRKAREVAFPTSSTKKQKKIQEPRKTSPWTCSRCPRKTFASQQEYMHHDCRQLTLKTLKDFNL